MSKIDKVCEEWMYQTVPAYKEGFMSKLIEDLVDAILIPDYPMEADHIRIHEISFVTDMHTDRILNTIETVIRDKNRWERLND